MSTARLNLVFAATLATVTSFVFVLMNMPTAALQVLAGTV
jgi:hypothetical protein